MSDNGSTPRRDSSLRSNLRGTRNFRKMMHFQHFMPGQLIALNEDITDAQAQGYGLVCEDPREKMERGVVYEVSGIDVRRWASRVYVLGVEGRFNSACFHAVS